MATLMTTRKLTRSEGLLTILGERVPAVSRSLLAFFDLVSVAFLTLVVVGGIPRFIESYERGEFKGTAQLFTVAGVAGEAHDRRRLDRRDSRVSRFGLAGVAARRARLMAAPVRLTRAA